MSETSKKGMRPDDIGRLRQVSDTQVSPDGQTIAFTVTSVDKDENRYTSRVWLAVADGSQRARPFSSGPDDGAPRWSPDGRFLAFSVNSKDAKAKVCVLPVGHGGERVTVAEWHSGIMDLEWSPDGSHIAFLARDPDTERYGTPESPKKTKDMPPRRVTRFFSQLDSEGWTFDRPTRIMIVASDGSSDPVVVTPGPFQADGFSWSPDGTKIVYSTARHDTWDLDWIVDLYTVASDGSGLPERITDQTAGYAMPTWSPDGSRIAYLLFPTPLDEPRHFQLGVLDVKTGETIELSNDLDRNCLPHGSERRPLWAGEQLIFGVEDAGNVHIYAVAADGNGKPEPVVEGERWLAAWDWAAGTLSMTVSTPSTFPELVVKRVGEAAQASALAGAQELQLTDLSKPFLAAVELGVPETYVGRSADGTEVPCWAIPPIGAEPGRKYPTLLNVHGGPFTSYGNKLFDEFQIEAGGGFGVVYCNPRGSSGYSEAWGRAVRWPEASSDPGSGWGGVDFEDVMACIEEATKRFSWIDSNRLGIIGGSYGGYMTSWAIGHTDRFKAAISERSCNNLLNLEINSDAATMFRGYIGKSIVEDTEPYLRQSPITYVKEMKTPVLILHSEDDLRCPISQGEELFVSLRLLGQEPEMVRFPGESHELSRSGSPTHRIMREEIILEFFKEKLGS
jgi:dipeptidyl aminopeptidase/acylaminoacyl peptidase